MERDAHASSIFSQSLDRAVFLVYFLGAVVPLLALGFVVHRYVLPAEIERFEAAALLGAVGGVGVLSLTAFFVLRRLARTTLSHLDAHNRRLAELLEGSRQLAVAAHGDEVLEAAARSAREVAEAHALVVLARDKDEEPFAPRSAAGKDALAVYEELAAELREPVELVASQGCPVLHQMEVGRDGRVEHGGFAAAVVPIETQRQVSGALVALRGEGGRVFGTRELDALAMLAGLAAVSLRNAQLQDAQRNFFSHVTDLLVTTLDQHVEERQGHPQRVARYANRIGRALHLDESRLERLHFAALLHDIGMLRIPRGQHSGRKACEKHPVLGFRMLQRIRLWEDIAPLVRDHHEWFDGSGYPAGLAGEAIALEARILSVADALEAMTRPTAERPARSPADAARELREHAGTQFDPELVDVVLGLIEQGELPLGDSADG